MKRKARRSVAGISCVLAVFGAAACTGSDSPDQSEEAIERGSDPARSEPTGEAERPDNAGREGPQDPAEPMPPIEQPAEAADAGTDPSAPPGDNPVEDPEAKDPSAPVTFVGAGDIAYCKSDADEATAKLLDKIPGTVFTVGDNVYDSGTEAEFRDCFEPTWGRHKSRIRPSVGNHEYLTRSAAPYYAYFGEAAGPAGKGYYSYELGSWHIVALNTNVPMDGASEQAKWLRADLEAHKTKCTIAYMHAPRFSSGDHGDEVKVTDLWRIMHERGVDVVLAGHDHHYERFAPQTPDGKADPNGIREFVVGTGGKTLRDAKGKANTEVVNAKTFGVLKMTLRDGAYDWTFVPVQGSTFTDEGTGNCH